MAKTNHEKHINAWGGSRPTLLQQIKIKKVDEDKRKSTIFATHLIGLVETRSSQDTRSFTNLPFPSRSLVSQTKWILCY